MLCVYIGKECFRPFCIFLLLRIHFHVERLWITASVRTPHRRRRENIQRIFFDSIFDFSKCNARELTAVEAQSFLDWISFTQIEFNQVPVEIFPYQMLLYKSFHLLGIRIDAAGRVKMDVDNSLAAAAAQLDPFFKGKKKRNGNWSTFAELRKL